MSRPRGNTQEGSLPQVTGALPEPGHTGTLKFLWFEPPSLWYFLLWKGWAKKYIFFVSIRNYPIIGILSTGKNQNKGGTKCSRNKLTQGTHKSFLLKNCCNSHDRRHWKTGMYWDSAGPRDPPKGFAVRQTRVSLFGPFPSFVFE